MELFVQCYTSESPVSVGETDCFVRCPHLLASIDSHDRCCQHQQK